MIMGMCSELDELEDAINNKDKINVKEEFGDIMWYVANYANELDLKIVEINTETIQYFSFQKNIFKLADKTKRFIAYGKEIDKEEVTLLIHKIVQGIAFSANNYQISFDDVLNRNIEKLRARFKDGFTEYDALNRNLDTEREILEQ